MRPKRDAVLAGCLVACILALLLARATVVQAASGVGPSAVERANEIPRIRAPFDYFELPLPQGWSCTYHDQLGERVYIFTPDRVEPGRVQGTEFTAFLIIQLVRMDPRGEQMTLEDILRGDLEYKRRMHEQAGGSLLASDLTQTELWGMEAVSARIRKPADSETELEFVGKRALHVYKVTCGWDDDQQDLYQPLLQRMVSELRFLEPPPVPALIRFQDRNGLFSLLLPSGWHVTQRDDGKTAQLFISRERIQQSTDRFKVGVTLTAIRRFSKSFAQAKTDKDALNLWLTGLTREAQKAPNQYYQVKPVRVGDADAVVWERSFRPDWVDFSIQEYRVVAAKNDTVYDVVMEAPVMEFERYREVFKKALGSVQFGQ